MLNLLPSGMIGDTARPWYFYDFVDPAPKFRDMGPDYEWDSEADYVSEGEGPLSDNPGDRKAPVDVPGYE